MKPLRNYSKPLRGMQGLFGDVRKYDIHTGIDLYCSPLEPVYTIEDGLIVNICDFTGKEAGSPWWNGTKAVLVEGKSGVILYGEIVPSCHCEVGRKILEGTRIGNVITVLKKDKQRPMTMLHLELYKTGYRGDGEIWNLNESQPFELLNPESLLR